MTLLTLLTTLAEKAYPQNLIEELCKDQPSTIRQAFMMNKNAQLRDILGGDNMDYPDRDRVTAIVK